MISELELRLKEKTFYTVTLVGIFECVQPYIAALILQAKDLLVNQYRWYFSGFV